MNRLYQCCSLPFLLVKFAGMQRETMKNRHNIFGLEIDDQIIPLLRACTDKVIHVGVVRGKRKDFGKAHAIVSIQLVSKAFIIPAHNSLRLDWISSRFSSCAYKKAAIIPQGKNELPISSQLYLSTSPLKKAERLVPFSQ